ncbi:MAG: AbrB/MazE/SpoVT family DNA-binding domain-containing protein [Elusimicrobia bacterium]|nr:AbrB/MazE/SpoVT family DNA-binding domain-containing protein [Elusimicrobiota bacterium]
MSSTRHTTVQKWGNSLALRIPSSLAKDVHLQRGSEVEVAIVEGAMVVKPKGGNKYSLAQLLKAVNKSNRHSEVDWGKNAGQETW